MIVLKVILLFVLTHQPIESLILKVHFGKYKPISPISIFALHQILQQVEHGNPNQEIPQAKSQDCNQLPKQSHAWFAFGCHNLQQFSLWDFFDLRKNDKRTESL